MSVGMRQEHYPISKLVKHQRDGRHDTQSRPLALEWEGKWRVRVYIDGRSTIPEIYGDVRQTLEEAHAAGLALSWAILDRIGPPEGREGYTLITDTERPLINTFRYFYPTSQV